MFAVSETFYVPSLRRQRVVGKSNVKSSLRQHVCIHQISVIRSLRGAAVVVSHPGVCVRARARVCALIFVGSSGGKGGSKKKKGEYAFYVLRNITPSCPTASRVYFVYVLLLWNRLPGDNLGLTEGSFPLSQPLYKGMVRTL